MADINVTLKIPSEKVEDVVTAINALHPVPKVRNDEGDLVEQYTEPEWAKEWIRRQLVNVVRRHKEMLAINQIRTGEVDDTVAEIVVK